MYHTLRRNTYQRQVVSIFRWRTYLTFHLYTEFVTSFYPDILFRSECFDCTNWVMNTKFCGWLSSIKIFRLMEQLFELSMECIFFFQIGTLCDIIYVSSVAVAFWGGKNDIAAEMHCWLSHGQEKAPSITVLSPIITFVSTVDKFASHIIPETKFAP